ncbi:MAG: amino acid adenylation domain-containing protein, partial [Acidobacteriota bacterium]
DLGPVPDPVPDPDGPRHHDASFDDILARVCDNALGAFAHQEIPFERILEEVAPERDLSRTPLFQIFFNMLNLPRLESRALLHGEPLEFEPLDRPEIESKFDLTVYLSEREDDAISLALVYRRDLFVQERMAELARQFERVLRQVADEPTIPIDRISLLTEPARRALGYLPSPHSSAFIGSVPERFLHQASAHPDKIALADPHLALSYARTARESAGLARHLRRLGIQPSLGHGAVVAVVARRNATLGIAVLGVLRAGAMVTILDPDLPAARRDRILRAARPHAVIEIRGETLGVSATETADACETAIDLPLGPDDPAILTFTSGSTGMPKGVVGRHGPLTHFLPWQADRFQHRPSDRVSVLSGLSHDPLQRDLFTPLCLGATAVFPDPAQRLEPGYIAVWMASQRISLSHLTPALAQVITEPAQALLPDLRCVFLVGESLTRRHVEGIQTLAPRAQVVNLYGSTETQRAVSFHAVSRQRPEGAPDTRPEILPLGRGMRDVDLLILDPSGELAGIGEIGEIHVYSPHLSHGYLADPALTAQRFVPCRLARHAGERVYCSGDLGRYLADGEVAFAGRTDRQVQVRGFRVEPGEIEAALARHPRVERVAVITHSMITSRSRLVAFLTLAELAEDAANPPSAEELRAWLGERLPAYMVPAAFHILDALPLTATAKVDRRALRELDAEDSVDAARAHDDSSFESPRGPTEHRLAEIWCDVLELPRVGRPDSFFALGGHSLLAVSLITRIDRELGVRLPLATLFSHPSLNALSSQIDRALGDPDSRAATSLQLLHPGSTGDAPPFICVHPAGGMLFGYRDLAQRLELPGDFYGIQDPGLESPEPTALSVEAMAERYLEDLRRVWPTGPYRLGGWSMGAMIAYEMACRLRSAGEEVAFLGLIDGGPARQTWARDQRASRGETSAAVSLLRELGLPAAQQEQWGQLPEDQLQERIWRHAIEHKVLPPDFDLETMRRAFRLQESHLESLLAYTPPASDLVVHLFVAGTRPPGLPGDLGWSRLGATVDAVEVPGDHQQMMRESEVRVLARELRKALLPNGTRSTRYSHERRPPSR